MAKVKTAYACSECGANALQWFGSCPSCGAAGTLTETITERGFVRRGKAEAESMALGDVPTRDVERAPTGLDELDRALGGGLVAGQVILLGGDPGIGKSTLLLQALSSNSFSGKSLYVTGEESAEQVALRARRLALDTAGVRLLAETQLERIVGALDAGKPGVAVLDSVPTIWSQTLQAGPRPGAPGRAGAAQLTRHAQRARTALPPICHPTQEG